MGTELPAEGFFRHRGLILTAAGGAVVEGGLLTLVAPNARPVAPQVTAIPSLAAYHDLRWLFTDTQSWLWFAALVAGVLLARTALDVAMIRLAWPRGVPAPRVRSSLVSCAALTLLAWVLLSPAATLSFGAAVLPFSWPFLAAFPLVLGIVAALSHGGVIAAWWRRFPPLRTVLWLLGSFAAATAAAAVITRLAPGEALAAVAVAGLVNARAWYGIAVLAARIQPRAHESARAAGVQPAVRTHRGGDGARPGSRRGQAHVHRHHPAADLPAGVRAGDVPRQRRPGGRHRRQGRLPRRPLTGRGGRERGARGRRLGVDLL